MGMTNALNLLCGLALFLYGMHVMGEGLTRASGGKLESILESLTKSKIKAVLLGAGVTAIIQSSSATTVMVVGFVNSGIMRLSQAAGVIMGANIGTTVTSWILSLTGLQGDSLLLTLCKPATFTPVLAFIGVCLLLFAKGDKKHDAGSIMIGFAVLMTGMEMMSGAVKPLADVPEFTNILLMFTNPILGVIAGAVLTAIIQSSSASVGILQALCVTGAVRDIINRSFDSFLQDDVELAKTVEPLEACIDDINVNVKSRHIERLTTGQCTIELGFVLTDISTNFERVSDHCSNIAVYQIQVPKDEYDAHEYLQNVKHQEHAEFDREEMAYEKQYRLPDVARVQTAKAGE